MKAKLEIGMRIQLTFAKKRTQKTAKVFKGEIVSIPNSRLFNVHNGLWQESFRFADINIPGGISVKVL